MVECSYSKKLEQQVYFEWEWEHDSAEWVSGKHDDHIFAMQECFLP